jgi:uncharacterized CHY-type Zn-finger protein
VQVHGHAVRGVEIDDETRCARHGIERDVVAILFPCCDIYYPCHRCHAEVAGHGAQQWPIDRRGEPGVLCGACGTELAIQEYLGVTACRPARSGSTPAVRTTTAGTSRRRPMSAEDA